MAQTDRQTDRAAAWIATAYNDEIELLEDASRYPSIVKEVHGGREMCPQTGKLHFQGAIILHSQQRLSALKRWLPTAHLEPAKSKEAIKRYCMKSETAVGDKTVRENVMPYYRMDEWLTMIATEIRRMRKDNIQEYIDLCIDDEDRTKEFWAAVEAICRIQPRAISALTNPAIKMAWKWTHKVWLSQPSLSITGTADKLVEEEDDLISPAEI